MKRLGLFFAFVLICSRPSLAQETGLIVAAAANVQFALEELKTSFESDTGIKLQTVIGSSGKITAQIENGAPFDIFLSADSEYPDALYEKNLTFNKPRIYAYGTLVLWTMNNVDLSRGIEALKDPSVRKIAIASPVTAPYGRQAVNALKHYQLYDQVQKKLVYGESIAQANQFITTKTADLGFTAKSIVLAPNMKTQGTWIEIDKDVYEPIAQGVVILKHAQKENLEDAQKFFDFLFSDQAGEIFKKYGYVLP